VDLTFWYYVIVVEMFIAGALLVALACFIGGDNA
jgi:hypothetical protein